MQVAILLLDNVDTSHLARFGRRPKSLSLLQMKELMSRFLNNSVLTEDMKISLSHKLGVTQGQVEHFFKTQRKKPRNVSIQAYSELLQGKRLKGTLLHEAVHVFTLYFLHRQSLRIAKHM